jgi:hypothetical protein
LWELLVIFCLVLSPLFSSNMGSTVIPFSSFKLNKTVFIAPSSLAIGSFYSCSTVSPSPIILDGKESGSSWMLSVASSACFLIDLHNVHPEILIPRSKQKNRVFVESELCFLLAHWGSKNCLGRGFHEFLVQKSGSRNWLNKNIVKNYLCKYLIVTH